MTYAEAVRHFGSQAQLARALGIRQPTVSGWGGQVPRAYQYELEVITGGVLKADRNCPNKRQVAMGGS